MKRVLIGLVRLYQIVISRPLHWLGGPAAGCRFIPTCSEFFLEAVHAHGAARGSWLGLKRLVRCHPWGGHGFDPVPPAKPASIPHVSTSSCKQIRNPKSETKSKSENSKSETIEPSVPL